MLSTLKKMIEDHKQGGDLVSTSKQLTKAINFLIDQKMKVNEEVVSYSIKKEGL